ncbi:MAG: aldehyde dehydrogenase family protein, partial [Frankiales bacterium]
MAIATIDPTNGETLKTFEPLTPAQLEGRLARAAAAAAEYRRTSLDERAGWLRAAADVLDAETELLAELMTTEMGKTLTAAKAEIGKCAAACRYYAEHGPAMLADEPVDAAAVKAGRAYVRWQPLGVVLAVMPWNFPMW